MLNETKNSAGAFGAGGDLNEIDRANLLKQLGAVQTNPYQAPGEFTREVLSLDGPAGRFSDQLAERVLSTDLSLDPVIHLKNLPVEETLPVFGHDDPVAEKYAKKKSFVTEALLTLAAKATDSVIFGYASISGGDLYHDIYLKEDLRDTPSQKSMVSFGFHCDMGFKSNRPDWANLVCLRSSAANIVSTSICRSIDILTQLDETSLKILSEASFFTPEEVISSRRASNLSRKPPVPVYLPDRPWKFEYFEKRTEAVTKEGAGALEVLSALCRRYSRLLVLKPGDLALVSNNNCLHCRDVISVSDEEAHRKRWLIKTYNCASERLSRLELLSDRFMVVDE
ncbi:MAG: hypothetical protein V6Z86_01530 [Hyphomicrobiales bacterium]